MRLVNNSTLNTTVEQDKGINDFDSMQKYVDN